MAQSGMTAKEIEADIKQKLFNSKGRASGNKDQAEITHCGKAGSPIKQGDGGRRSRVVEDRGGGGKPGKSQKKGKNKGGKQSKQQYYSLGSGGTAGGGTVDPRVALGVGQGLVDQASGVEPLAVTTGEPIMSQGEQDSSSRPHKKKRPKKKDRDKAKGSSMEREVYNKSSSIEREVYNKGGSMEKEPHHKSGSSVEREMKNKGGAGGGRETKSEAVRPPHGQCAGSGRGTQLEERRSTPQDLPSRDHPSECSAFACHHLCKN